MQLRKPWAVFTRVTSVSGQHGYISRLQPSADNRSHVAWHLYRYDTHTHSNVSSWEFKSGPVQLVPFEPDDLHSASRGPRPGPR
jgi:hypothetical protein